MLMPMARPTKDAPKIARVGVVSKWTAGIHVMVAEKLNERGNRMGGPDLILEGQFLRPVKGKSQFMIQLHPSAIRSDVEIGAAGVLTKSTPSLQFLVFVDFQEFAHVTMLLASGQQLHCAMTFDTPRYGKADIHSFGVSTQPYEDED